MLKRNPYIKRTSTYSINENRLAEFGFSYFGRHFDCYDATVTVIEDKEEKSTQQEPVDLPEPR